MLPAFSLSLFVTLHWCELLFTIPKAKSVSKQKNNISAHQSCYVMAAFFFNFSWLLFSPGDSTSDILRLQSHFALLLSIPDSAKIAAKNA